MDKYLQWFAFNAIEIYKKEKKTEPEEVRIYYHYNYDRRAQFFSSSSFLFCLSSTESRRCARYVCVSWRIGIEASITNRCHGMRTFEIASDTFSILLFFSFVSARNWECAD